MKTIFGIICAICLFSSFAQATSLHPDTFTQSAKLLTWEFDAESFLSTRGVRGGTVSVNAVSKIISIRFDLRNNCPPHAFCIAYIPTKEVTLPLKKVVTDSCGSVTYTAELNKLPVDGIHEKIVVTDVSQSICEMVYVAPTMITYSEGYFNHQDGKFVKTKSYLTADRLE
ncbi:MAG: hypothetical protein A2X86_14570 [Bdellovibrionales bacterium GWA2_49_15]|nr:MAG: hypothetical protein A2X86_14570 [Bdellovibrionales bacterium GWA2_49_15]HAZ13436.1 hypothetical protein [Bdellovibrionales bacterium]